MNLSIYKTVFVVAVVLGVADTAFAIQYEIIDLGVLPEAPAGSSAFDINNQGNIVGSSFVNLNGNAANSWAVMWQDGNSSPEPLWEVGLPCIIPGLCGNDTEPIYVGGNPAAINESGVVVGRARSLGGYTGTPLPTPEIPEGFSFISDETNNFRRIPNPSGRKSEAVGINDNGLVVGSGSISSESYQAYTWSDADGFTYLGTLEGGRWSRGKDINNQGQVVGYSEVANEDQSAFIYDPVNGMQDIGSLGSQAVPFAINESSQVVGFSHTSPGGRRAFIWDSDSGMREIVDPSQPGVIFRIATDINNNGVAIGQADFNGDTSDPVIWTKNDGIININDLVTNPDGWELGSFKSINDSGQIVGLALYQGELRAVLLNPVPEPSGLVLLTFGIASILFYFFRTRNKTRHNF